MSDGTANGAHKLLGKNSPTTKSAKPRTPRSAPSAAMTCQRCEEVPCTTILDRKSEHRYIHELLDETHALYLMQYTEDRNLDTDGYLPEVVRNASTLLESSRLLDTLSRDLPPREFQFQW